MYIYIYRLYNPPTNHQPTGVLNLAQRLMADGIGNKPRHIMTYVKISVDSTGKTTETWRTDIKIEVHLVGCT